MEFFIWVVGWNEIESLGFEIFDRKFIFCCNDGIFFFELFVVVCCCVVGVIGFKEVVVIFIVVVFWDKVLNILIVISGGIVF